MDEFARYGFDVWTMDHEGYGRSTRTDSNSDILSGVEDLRAALPVIEKVTGHRSVMIFGQSSGAIRAGAFANCEPERVERLVLDAFTYTGENAPRDHAPPGASSKRSGRARTGASTARLHRHLQPRRPVHPRARKALACPLRRGYSLHRDAPCWAPAPNRKPETTLYPASSRLQIEQRPPAGYGYSGTPAFRPAAIAPAAA